MDIDIDGAGVVYDYTGPIVILCWSSQIEKCVKRLNAVFYDLLSDVDLVVSSWLFVSLRRRRQLKPAKAMLPRTKSLQRNAYARQSHRL